ncbi:uncharacterized protein LOC143373934 [Andrena cerasifolii]|uniref:uncharacterized protein LOC143373934 n=1 Tax=Andrena cerasifolii TaxID=2819439 RepID=UPI0040384262
MKKLFKNRRIGTEIIVMGDFNAHNREWNCWKEDREGTILAEIIEEQDLFVINDKTTSRTGSGKHRPSNLDLLITTFEIYQDTRVREEGETLGSDHQVIEVVINRDTQTWDPNKYTTRKYNTEEIKWKDLKEAWMLGESNTKEKFNNANSLTEKYKIMMQGITNGMETIGIKRRSENTREEKNTNDPKGNGKKTLIRRQYPWWDEECKEKKEARKKAVRDFVKNPMENNWKILKREEKEMNKMIKEKKNKSWEEMALSIDHRTRGSEIWGKIKRLQKGFEVKYNTYTSIEERRQLEEKEINKILQDPLEREEGTEMEEGGTREEEGEIYRDDEENMEREGWNQKITLWEIETAIKKSNIKSAPGENGIDYKIIKNLTKEYKEMMKNIFNESWNRQEILDDWKKAIIIFLDKTNKKALRPISLTDCMGKVMERVVNRRLTE